jgi:glucose/arabinose dehydrogenase
MCSPQGQKIALTPMFAGVGFTRPVAVLAAPGDDEGFYIVEKRGVVFRMPTATSGGPQAQVVADIRSRVNSAPNEAGLLGMAFHPQFEQNRLVYLSYTTHNGPDPDDLTSRLSRFEISSTGALDPNSEEILISFDQPFENHNGGHVVFGPDGFLYAGFGDGGYAGDPFGHGQNKNNLFGTIIRIDVDNDDGNGYAIPTDNPFASGGGRPEIFAWGLRNPWRFNFDRETHELWAGDVGQDAFEEVDIVVLGGNYGWRSREGAHCFASPCSGDFIEPVVEYGRTEGISITGGYVYRGSAIPALHGVYVYGDYATQTIWGVGPSVGLDAPVVLAQSGQNMAAFGEGHDGELYVVNHLSGRIFRIVAGTCEDDP